MTPLLVTLSILNAILSLFLYGTINSASFIPAVDPQWLSFVKLLFLSSMTATVCTSILNLVRRSYLPLSLFSLFIFFISGALIDLRIPGLSFLYAGSSSGLGINWFLLNLLCGSTLFIALEKTFPMNAGQKAFRSYWKTDTGYFMFNHIATGSMLVLFNWLVTSFLSPLQPPDASSLYSLSSLRYLVHNLPFFGQLLLAIVIADFSYYWLHRAYHKNAFLWKFHKVHHTVQELDWIAGSRIHFIELFTTGLLVLGVLFLFGFSLAVLNTYVIIVGIHSVFINHSNVRLPWGFMRHVVVTPSFHHWHHANKIEPEQRSKNGQNFAAHFPIMDKLFGTCVQKKESPPAYGLPGVVIPEGFIVHQKYPFSSSAIDSQKAQKN